MSQQQIEKLAMKFTHDRRIARLVSAIAMQESGGDPNAFGDNGLAWGLFQFHRERWHEISTDGYRDCKVEFQVAVMINMIQSRYLGPKVLAERMSIGSLSSEDLCIIAGQIHNRGHFVCMRHTDYTRSLYQWFLKGSCK